MSYFLIRDDEIQLDKSIYFMRTKIVSLKSEIKYLTEKNQQLQNKPYEQMSQLIVVGTSPKNNTLCDEPIDTWKSAHFVSYFCRLYSRKYDVTFHITPSEWRAYAVRVKMFRSSKVELKDNTAFKDYLDWVFDHVFDDKFIASVALCTSTSVYYNWVIKTKKKTTSVEKFQQLATDSKMTTSTDIDTIFEDAF